MITASGDRTIKIWHLNSSQPVRTLTGHNNWINGIAINAQGQILASAGRDGVKLWNLTNGELINTLMPHSDWVNAIAFSPDGQTLATGGFDGRVNIWRIAPKSQY